MKQNIRDHHTCNLRRWYKVCIQIHIPNTNRVYIFSLVHTSRKLQLFYRKGHFLCTTRLPTLTVSNVFHGEILKHHFKNLINKSVGGWVGPSLNFFKEINGMIIILRRYTAFKKTPYHIFKGFCYLFNDEQIPAAAYTVHIKFFQSALMAIRMQCAEVQGHCGMVSRPILDLC